MQGHLLGHVVVHVVFSSPVSWPSGDRRHETTSADDEIGRIRVGGDQPPAAHRRDEPPPPHRRPARQAPSPPPTRRPIAASAHAPGPRTGAIATPAQLHRQRRERHRHRGALDRKRRHHPRAVVWGADIRSAAGRTPPARPRPPRAPRRPSRPRPADRPAQTPAARMSDPQRPQRTRGTNIRWHRPAVADMAPIPRPPAHRRRTRRAVRPRELDLPAGPDIRIDGQRARPYDGHRWQHRLGPLPAERPTSTGGVPREQGPPSSPPRPDHTSPTTAQTPPPENAPDDQTVTPLTA